MGHVHEVHVQGEVRFVLPLDVELAQSGVRVSMETDGGRAVMTEQE